MAALGFRPLHARRGTTAARACCTACASTIPSKVERAAFLDILPQHHLLNHVNLDFGVFSWHWFFMVQPYDFPERLMSAPIPNTSSARSSPRPSRA